MLVLCPKMPNMKGWREVGKIWNRETVCYAGHIFVVVVVLQGMTHEHIDNSGASSWKLVDVLSTNF